MKCCRTSFSIPSFIPGSVSKRIQTFFCAFGLFSNILSLFYCCRVEIVTWNVGSAMPPDDISNLFSPGACDGSTDMFIVGWDALMCVFFLNVFIVGITCPNMYLEVLIRLQHWSKVPLCWSRCIRAGNDFSRARKSYRSSDGCFVPHCLSVKFVFVTDLKYISWYCNVFSPLQACRRWTAWSIRG